MQTLISCMQCQVETGHPNFKSHIAVDVPESGVVEMTCDRGHRTFSVIQQAKFEILSEIAVNSLAKGVYRESVLSFASSLERLQEFFVDATCRKRSVPDSEFAIGWKPMANLSERQLGAFLIAFLIETQTAPKILHAKQVAFRNAVIHKGKLVTRDEAVVFGKAVFECALPVLTTLRAERYATTIQAMTSERVRERSKFAREAGERVSFQSVATPLSFALADQPTNFEELIESYAKRPTVDQIVSSADLFGGIAQRNGRY